MDLDWNFDFVYSRVFTSKHKLTGRQWSGFIHHLHKRFGFEKIVIDAGAGGGGILVSRELRAHQQLIEGIETKSIPICDQLKVRVLWPMDNTSCTCSSAATPGSTGSGRTRSIPANHWPVTSC